VGLLIAVVTNDGVAGTSKQIVKDGNGKIKGPHQGKNTVTITGTVSGSLQGRIRVANRDVVITKQTRIYRTGKGLVDQGTLVTRSPVYVIGMTRDGTTYATLVIVSDPKVSSKGGPVRVLDPDEPL
jgi:hypothetical protein